MNYQRMLGRDSSRRPRRFCEWEGAIAGNTKDLFANPMGTDRLDFIESRSSCAISGERRRTSRLRSQRACRLECRLSAPLLCRPHEGTFCSTCLRPTEPHSSRLGRFFFARSDIESAGGICSDARVRAAVTVLYTILRYGDDS